MNRNEWEGHGFQWAVNELPRSFRREIALVFPELREAGWTGDTGLRVVSTFQPADVDLAGVDSQVDAEKDELLERYARWARGVCGKLRAMGAWADGVDPCSGHPLEGRPGPTIFDEVEAARVLLRFSVFTVGQCALIAHPDWGTACYPASLVTTASVDTVTTCIRDFLS